LIRNKLKWKHGKRKPKPSQHISSSASYPEQGSKLSELVNQRALTAHLSLQAPPGLDSRAGQWKADYQMRIWITISHKGSLQEPSIIKMSYKMRISVKMVFSRAMGILLQHSAVKGHHAQSTVMITTTIGRSSSF